MFLRRYALVELTGHYNSWIITLSFVIAYFTSFQALGLTKKVTRQPGKIAWGWLIVAGIVMGCGIWTMHFVGMIAFHLPIDIDYDVFKTILSLAASILASLLAFYVTSTRITQLKIIFSSILMASAITVMHYMGMSSMLNEFMTIDYDPILWTISNLIALLASYVAIQLFIKMKQAAIHSTWFKLVAALMMAIAVSGMHYVGMEASLFWCIDPQYINSLQSDEPPTRLLTTVLVVISGLVLLTGVAQMWEQRIFRKMAYTDSLTGLSNRHAMNEFFRNTPLYSNRLALLFIDLDQFKYVNDTLGHDAGDLLIQEIGGRFRRLAVSQHHIYRLGGDEFLLIVPYSKKEEVLDTVTLLLKEIRNPIDIENHRLEITGSIGISYTIEHGDTKDSLLKAADTAMYYAKKLGKNQYCEYNAMMAQKVNRRLSIEKGMRDALTKREYQLHYQPKWNVDTSEPIGFEALLRFKHHELGDIEPNEFIPIAEETGFIVALSEWILERACMDCAQWNEQNNSNYVVSVNITSKLIKSNMLLSITNRALSLSGLPPHLLELEITEQVIMNCGQEVGEQLLPLQHLGVKLSVDNFGSGYTFLGTLEQFAFQSIKIDRKYIEEYDAPVKRAVIQSIIGLAKQLNIQLIAEGVETQTQLNYLKDAGCNLMQGYYFKKPMPLQELQYWLKQLDKT